MTGAGMKAEIIAVGSEMLTPDHSDTNSLRITEKLNEAGFQVHLKSIVGDDEDDLAGLLNNALTRSNLIVVSGGLGPTEDDVTRSAVAKALGRRLSTSAAVLEDLCAKFARRGFRMTKINERQAEVIEGAEVLDNSVGSAPGMWLEEHGVHIALLPGPPHELTRMLENAVLPRAQRLGQGRRLAKMSFRITGMTESEVDALVAPVYRQYPQVQTTILAALGHIGLRLQQWVGAGENPASLSELAVRISESLGSAVFTTADESLEEVVGRLLRETGQTLAVAESCTAGMIGSHITRIAGSSDYFLGGILCYGNDAKIRLCGVPDELIRNHGAVSAEVAEALARGVRGTLRSSIGLSVTGIAGPGGGSEEKPVGLVYVGFSDRTRSSHLRRIFSGSRQMVRERSTYLALSFLRRQLISEQEIR
jgi:nicotinamide-nucleotide amidase